MRFEFLKPWEELFLYSLYYQVANLYTTIQTTIVALLSGLFDVSTIMQHLIKVKVSKTSSEINSKNQPKLWNKSGGTYGQDRKKGLDFQLFW